MQVLAIQPARSGRQNLSGVRQSIPSSSMASCDGDSITEPPDSGNRGQKKMSAVDTLGEQAQPLAIPKQDLYQRSILPAEDEQKGSFFRCS
jgi:hypothetical protein